MPRSLLFRVMTKSKEIIGKNVSGGHQPSKPLGPAKPPEGGTGESKG